MTARCRRCFHFFYRPADRALRFTAAATKTARREVVRAAPDYCEDCLAVVFVGLVDAPPATARSTFGGPGGGRWVNPGKDKTR